MKIQDIYVIGQQIQSQLVTRGVLNAKTPEELERIWKKSIESVQRRVKSGEIPTIDFNRDCVIDWNFYTEEADA